jgi:signal transduction histidine kinase
MKTDTLSFRLFLFTSLWMLVSLAIVAILVSRDYRNTLEKQFEDLVTANLFNLMGSIKSGSDGKLFGTPQLGDSRYQKYHSGWYWTVNSLPDKKTSMSSPSLAGVKLSAPTGIKFDSEFQRAYRMGDEAGNELMIVEAQVYLGEGDDLYAFRTSGNLAVLDEDILNFRQRLILLLGIFGVGLIVTSFAIVRFGLKPIRFATSQLAEIRGGESNRIEGKFPREIVPLIEETNALIKSNQSIVERSRTQVGNLAHSLKTPLSILSLEVKNLPKPLATIMQAQLSVMNSQIQSYLNRAMISARHGAITSRTDVDSTLSRMVRTFNKLFPKISFDYNRSADGNLKNSDGYSSDHAGKFDGVFAGEQQDLEEIIGNIMENAGKSASSAVQITARMPDRKLPRKIEIEIADDGPGLTNSEIEYVLKRGNRLDETKPGSGLGLSIVRDVLREYGGTMLLSTTDDGGLRVVVQIPAV